MTKSEFLKALEGGLSAASPDERVAAMQYYTEYIDEAGPEREAEVLAELGDPSKVAADVLASGSEDGKTGWTPPAKPDTVAAGTPLDAAAESGIQLGVGPAPAGPVPPPQAGGALPVPLPAPNMPPPPQPGSQTGYNKNNNSIAKIVLIILAFIVLSPLLGGVLGVLVSVVVVLAVVFFLPIILGVSFVAAGIACAAVGVGLLAPAMAHGLVNLGVGICLVGLGLMCIYAGGRLVGKTLPRAIGAIVSGIGSFFRRLFGKA